MLSIAVARRNRLLALLPAENLADLLPNLELRENPIRTIFQPRGELAESAHFPITGVASMISEGEGGNSIEVATIGYEGMTGLSLFLGGEHAALETFMQVPGQTLRVPATKFKRHAAEPPFTRILHIYTQALIAQIAQSSACNRVHPVEQRCARWLLQSHDRVRADEFSLTHEFLGIMLGVRRASVSEVAEKLQEQRLIRYHRGVITVIDRKGLEKAACTCYAFVARVYDDLFGSEFAVSCATSGPSISASPH